jgi:hypothetical protein
VPSRRLTPGPVERAQVIVPTHQTGAPHRRLSLDARCGRLAAQERQVEQLGLRVRVGPEIVGQSRRECGVDLQRCAHPTVHRERVHQVAVGPFVVGVGLRGDKRADPRELGLTGQQG